MKLIILLLTLNLVQISANVYSQKNSITVKDQNLTLKEVIELIEDQTDYRFVFRDNFLNDNKKVFLSADEKNVEDLLPELFTDTNLEYYLFEDYLIVITPSDRYLKQEIVVKGKIIDKDGNPLPGVNIVEVGTTNGSITDIDGNYSITVSSPDVKLSFSFIGYLTEEITVDGRTTVDITLVEDIQALEEVVVVGYGIHKKETLTGSVSNVSGKEIVKSPSSNVTSSLGGKLPGLVVNQRSGEPGRDDPDILIRGNGTFGDNSPLIIIDGVERSMMSRLNPDDIESVSVLKDASAAIYGARAANGVILITTKMGKVGKPVFNLTVSSAFEHPTKIPEVLDAATFAEVFNEAEWYRQGRPDEFTPFYSDAAIQKYRDGSDPILYPNTNWVDEVLKPYSLQKRIGLQVNGGSEAIRYLLSFATLNQDGHYKNNPTNYNQYNMRAKVDVNLTKNLVVGANINAILNKKEYSSENTETNFYNIIRSNPTLVARYPNGLIAPGRLGENPLLNDQRGYDKIDDTPIYSTFTASYNVPFVEGLKLDASFNYDVNNQFEKLYNLPYFYHEYDVNTQEYNKVQATKTSTVELTDTYSKWTTMMYNFRISYDKTFGNHHVAAMLGQEQQKNSYTWASAYRKNFVSSAIDQINVGSSSPDDKDNGGSSTESAYNNYFGRFNYDFSSKYLVEFLFRYDGSQIFPEGKRYGFFPGVSLGWRLSEEDFIRNSISAIDELKIRFSHGEIGNDRVGQYQYLQSYSFGNNYVFGTTDASGIYANTMPNPNITWEVSKKTDFGVETSLWNNLLGVDFTLWKENRSNILAQRNLSIPNILGFSDLPSENIGEVKNHGLELIVKHRKNINSFIYNVGANVSFARSEIVFMDETPQSEEYQNQTGLPVGAELYYKADGIFNTQEELDGYPHVTGTQVGDIKIIDLNNDGEINSDDQYRFDKTATPEIVFGLNLGLQYKNFDFSMFFQGQTNAYNYDGAFSGLGSSAFDNAFVARAEDRWTVDNQNGTMPRAAAYSPGNTTFFLYDATFVRLKNMEIGYSLPESWISKIALEDLRLYMNGFNLLTWAKEIKWSDPELNGSSIYYPQLRVINLGVNVKF